MTLPVEPPIAIGGAPVNALIALPTGLEFTAELIIPDIPVCPAAPVEAVVEADTVSTGRPEFH